MHRSLSVSRQDFLVKNIFCPCSGSRGGRQKIFWSTMFFCPSGSGGGHKIFWSKKFFCLCSGSDSRHKIFWSKMFFCPCSGSDSRHKIFWSIMFFVPVVVVAVGTSCLEEIVISAPGCRLLSARQQQNGNVKKITKAMEFLYPLYDIN